MITQERLKEHLIYDKYTGIFTRAKDTHGGRWKKGQIVGTIQKVTSNYSRAKISINGKYYMSHRLAWLYEYGVMPKEIDHLNNNPLDNRIYNLIEVSHLDNMKKLKRNHLNTSGENGIIISNDRAKKFRVRIGSGKMVSFYSMEDAVAYRDKLLIENNYHENHGIQLNKEL